MIESPLSADFFFFCGSDVYMPAIIFSDRVIGIFPVVGFSEVVRTWASVSHAGIS